MNRGLSLLAASVNLVGLTLEALQWLPLGVGVGLAFHGFYCFLIGYLIFRSTFLPRILGAVMTIAGLSWLTYLSTPLASYLSPYNLTFGLPRGRIDVLVAPRDGREYAEDKARA